MSQTSNTLEMGLVPALVGRQVLVADDDAVCRTLASDALAAAGAGVGEARDGREAVLRVVADVPDLLVTDLDMPELDGLAAVGILRWDFGLVSLPIIAVSSAEPPATRLLEAGVNAFLPKPLDPERLVAAVVACLEGVADPEQVSGAAPSPVVFDLAGALARMGGRSGLLVRLVTVFLENHRGSGAELATALAVDDTNRAHRICHALTGTGASVGAIRLQAVAADLEKSLRAGDVPGVMEVAGLSDILAETVTTMTTWLAATSDRPGS